jgi:hypothetical protein
MLLFVTVATVTIAAMIIGASRSKAGAMPVVVPPVAEVDSVALLLSSIPLSTPSSSSSPQTPQSTQTPQTPPVRANVPPPPVKALPSVPSIGSVQVLNGCGAEGAANKVADFLRSKGFDVKDIGNASTWKHQSTMIISRTADMGLANGIERLMKTGKVVLIRNGDSMYDVTVVAGPDFEERIK